MLYEIGDITNYDPQHVREFQSKFSKILSDGHFAIPAQYGSDNILFETSREELLKSFEGQFVNMSEEPTHYAVNIPVRYFHDEVVRSYSEKQTPDPARLVMSIASTISARAAYFENPVLISADKPYDGIVYRTPYGVCVRADKMECPFTGEQQVQIQASYNIISGDFMEYFKAVFDEGLTHNYQVLIPGAFRAVFGISPDRKINLVERESLYQLSQSTRFKRLRKLGLGVNYKTIDDLLKLHKDDASLTEEKATRRRF